MHDWQKNHNYELICSLKHSLIKMLWYTEVVLYTSSTVLKQTVHVGARVEAQFTVSSVTAVQ